MLVAIIAAWSPMGTRAQDQAAASPLDLAAMALAADDVPAGFFDDYFELWTPGESFADFVSGGTPAPAGLERLYQSFYFSPDEGMGIVSFLLEFASAGEAEAGASIVDAMLRPPLPEGETIGPSHEPGPGVGEAPQTTTIVAYDTWASDGPRVEVIATSFRREQLIAGVAVEHWTDPPQLAEGTPSASPVASPIASPVGPDPEQQELAASLASVVDNRITDVLAGVSPAGADLALPGMTLPIEQLGDASLPVIGGYKSGADLLRCGICGEENSLVPFESTALGGFSRTMPVGPLQDGEPSPPFVSVAVSSYASPEDALAVLEAIRLAPNDRPTPGPVPRGNRTLAVDPVVPGADSAVAFLATSDPDNPDAPIDSAGVDFVVGAWLVTIDVQGGLTGDEAMAVAVDLASQQAVCLTSGEPCAEVTRPAQLG
jgi:hypothetical protein